MVDCLDVIIIISVCKLKEAQNTYLPQSKNMQVFHIDQLHKLYSICHLSHQIITKYPLHLLQNITDAPCWSRYQIHLTISLYIYLLCSCIVDVTLGRVLLNLNDYYLFIINYYLTIQKQSEDRPPPRTESREKNFLPLENFGIQEMKPGPLEEVQGLRHEHRNSGNILYVIVS